MPIPVSTLILTLNEESNLPRCLAGLEWCDDIIVLDSGSKDRTLDIAEQSGARVFHREFDSFAGQRNWGLDNISFKHPWILHLDADEVCTEELATEIAGRINDDRYYAFRIPSRTIFLGKWMRFAGMYPTYQVRLGRNPGLRFTQVGHGQREEHDSGPIGTLHNAYDHHSFSKGLHDWFAKHNRYSSDEAAHYATHHPTTDWRGLLSFSNATRRRRALKTLASSLPFRPTLRFWYMYFIRMGILDGYAGYQYCKLLSLYEAMIEVKRVGLRNGKM